MQQILDAALQQASIEEKCRFAQLTSSGAADDVAFAEADRQVSTDPNIGVLLEWLDRHAGWPPGMARRKVVERLAVTDRGELYGRRQRHVQVKQMHVADALST